MRLSQRVIQRLPKADIHCHLDGCVRPRTMLELAWQMPDVDLIPFPVISEKMRNEPWWTAASMRLLLFEYVKYLVAQVRTRLEPASASTDFAGDRRRPRS